MDCREALKNGAIGGFMGVFDEYNHDLHNMNSAILACNTVADELKLAVKETGAPHPILWIESGLHNSPALLRERLQEELCKIKDVDCVLLAFGFCGNAVLGLKTGDFQLVIPRADDCITLLIGSNEQRLKVGNGRGTYFLTKGWVDNEKNIWEEYKQSVNRFGQCRTDRLYKTLLKHYRQLGIIDTGAYDLNEFLPTSQVIAKDLNLEHVIISGTTAYFRKLLTGPYDDDFVVIAPGLEVSFEDLCSLKQQP